MKMVYVIGEPGSGKTTAARKLIEQLGPAILLQGTAKGMLFHESGTLLLGHYDERTFSGTDTLSYTAAEEVTAFLLTQAQGLGVKCVFGEGDRLANSAFFSQCATFCELTVVCFTVAPETAAKRRAERGSNQNPTWVKGRASKVRRLAAEFKAKEIPTDFASPTELASYLLQLLWKKI